MELSRSVLVGSLVATVLVLSCQSEAEFVTGVDDFTPRFDKPTCPSDHPSCGDDGGTSANRTVDVSGGLLTLDSQEVPVSSDTKRLYAIGAGGNGGFEVRFDLTNTHASYPGSCVTSGGGQEGQLEFDDLAALLTDDNQDRGFVMRFFRREQDQQLSQIDINWSDPADGQGSFDLWVGSTPSMDELTPVPDVVASESDPNAAGCVDYTYSGGAAQIAQSHGTGRSHPSVVCPLHPDDEVTVTVCPA
ncbi:MAG: hypothetical protein P8Y29_07215 [Gemmatimonadota bacterium]|jgi:hypothetical protein